MRGPIAQAGAAILVLALAGCGSPEGGEPTVNATGTAEASANAPLAPAPTGASAPAPDRKAPTVSPTPRPGQKAAPVPATQFPPPPPENINLCQAGHLTIRAVRQPSADLGAMTALVVTTNTGMSPCALSGWPKVALIRNGADVGVPTTNVNEPRSPVGMVLRPGRSAFAGLRWTSCAPVALSCHTGTDLQIAAPGTSPVQAKLLGFPSKQLRMSRLEIGSIQPTTTNIINW